MRPSVCRSNHCAGSSVCWEQLTPSAGWGVQLTIATCTGNANQQWTVAVFWGVRGCLYTRGVPHEVIGS